MNKRIRRKKIREMLLAELALAFEHADAAESWLEKPLPALEGRSPRQAISDGEVERITLLLDAMNGVAHPRE